MNFPLVRWLLAAFICASTASAQSVRGTVASNERGVSGVVVLLLDSTSNIVARALTGARGEYRLAAPRSGVFQIRTLRIGFRPVVSDAFRLASGHEEVRPITLDAAQFALDTLRVVGLNSCHLARDSGQATYRVWEQIRTALIAAQLTSRAQIKATTLAYERLVDPDSRRVRKQYSRVASNYVNEPWLALHPDSLRQLGYVALNSDFTTTYFAPGLDALLSDAFLEDHCFRLTTDSTRVGIAFVPASHRDKFAEITGTLWVDRASSELRRLDFRYANVSRAQQEHAGGEIDFVRMRDGMWAIATWSIRMPVLEQKVANAVAGKRDSATITGARVIDMVVAGGELVLASRARDTLWAQPPRILTGALTDSITGAPLSGAWIVVVGTSQAAVSGGDGRFTIPGLLPGTYTVDVHTAALDALNALHQTVITFNGTPVPIPIRVPPVSAVISALCGGRVLVNPGIVLGRVGVVGDSAPPRDLRVLAEWPDSPAAIPGSVARTNRIESRVDGSGTFRFCGVPVNTAIALRSLSDSGTSQGTALTIPSGERFSRAEIGFDWKARHGAEVFGVVLADSTQEPIAGAEVSFPALAKTVVTNDSGAFRLSEVPAGSHQFVVRRFGFGPLDMKLDITSTQDVQRKIVLARSVTLATVNTVESLLPASFEEHRKMGFGVFVIRDELVQSRGRQLSNVLEMKRGIGIVRGHGGHAWVISKRGAGSACNTLECMRRERRYYIPSKSEVGRGMIPACYSQVYLDKVLMNPGRPSEPFDLNSIPPEQIEGIEFYPGEAQLPMQYLSQSNSCGVLQIWNRRSP